jgi:hypothetical protein
LLFIKTENMWVTALLKNNFYSTKNLKKLNTFGLMKIS